MKIGTQLLMIAVLGATPLMGFAQQAETKSADGPSTAEKAEKIDVRSKKPALLQALVVAKSDVNITQKIVDEDAQIVAKLKLVIRERTGLPSSSGLQPLVSELQLQREKLEQEEAAAAGRRAGLEETIAAWTERAKARVVDDASIKEFELTVTKDQMEATRDEKLRAANAISEAEYEAALASLAVSKARVVAARQRSAASANEATDIWNRELMNLNIAAQERAARLKYINNRLTTLEPVLDELDHLESTTIELRAAEQNLRAARQRFQELEQTSAN